MVLHQRRVLFELVGTDVVPERKAVSMRGNKGLAIASASRSGKGNSVLINDIGLNLGSSLVNGFPCGLTMQLVLAAGMAQAHSLVDQKTRHVEVGMGRVIQQVFAQHVGEIQLLALLG